MAVHTCMQLAGINWPANYATLCCLQAVCTTIIFVMQFHLVISAEQVIIGREGIGYKVFTENEWSLFPALNSTHILVWLALLSRRATQVCFYEYRLMPYTFCHI